MALYLGRVDAACAPCGILATEAREISSGIHPSRGVSSAGATCACRDRPCDRPGRRERLRAATPRLVVTRAALWPASTYRPLSSFGLPGGKAPPDFSRRTSPVAAGGPGDAPRGRGIVPA